MGATRVTCSTLSEQQPTVSASSSSCNTTVVKTRIWKRFEYHMCQSQIRHEGNGTTYLLIASTKGKAINEVRGHSNLSCRCIWWCKIFSVSLSNAVNVILCRLSNKHESGSTYKFAYGTWLPAISLCISIQLSDGSTTSCMQMPPQGFSERIHASGADEIAQESRIQSRNCIRTYTQISHQNPPGGTRLDDMFIRK